MLPSWEERVRFGSPQKFSRSSQRGFTLLELTIAMMFVVILVSGITLTISTCLNVWERSQEMADLNQEARAITEIISRDMRGAYLGLERTAGYFVSGGAQPGQLTQGELVEFTTESSEITKAALLPPSLQAEEEEEEQIGPPISDYVAVRYQFLEGTSGRPAGLYRMSWVAPRAEWATEPPPQNEASSIEYLSSSVRNLSLRYFDAQSQGWSDGWITDEQNRRLPSAVSVELTLEDARQNEHVYQSIIPLPMR